LSPEATAELLKSRHGAIHLQGSDEVQSRQERYRHEIDRGTIEILYHYGENIVEGSDIEMGPDSINVPGFGNSMTLNQAKTKYSDLIKS
jgi:acetoacetyl-[acyl-carrier protein] synthase